MSSPAPSRIGRYVIERKIGEGGMGIVYAARDERLDRTVALKTIRGASDDTARKRLWREARAAAGISHPNVCQLYEVDETDDGLVLAMELLDGEPLGARLARGPLSPADSSSIALQALDALEALHGRGLIHRDLKPSNLFLTPRGVKLLDFGLARPVSGSFGAETTLLTEAGVIVGTPNYMAPEQVRGEALDARADLFSIAAMLFEMLSGRLAFSGATMIDVLHAVLHEQPPALSGGAMVAGLDRVIHKALQKQPADRYESALAMTAAIRDVMAVRDSVNAPATRPMTRLIALPFRVLRPDAETDFLAVSLPDAITMSLTGTPNLLVRSSAAASRVDPHAPDLRKLASDADVDVALMGTILRAGTRLRATAQLVETPGGTVMWSHSSQHALDDVFAMQDELVAGIVGSLSQSLGGPESRVGGRDVPRSSAAYELYLRANQLARDWDHIGEARDVYQQCVALDSQFAPAWAGLGRCQRVLGKYFELPGATRDAERSFERAQALNPDLPVLHKYYAQLECDAGRAVDAMRRLLRRATAAVDPEYFAGLVHACRYAGLLDASVAAHEEARRLDPTVPTSVTNTYQMLGDYEQVLRIAETGDDGKVMALYRLGRRDEALAGWQGAPADAPATFKAWDRMIVACLSEASDAREVAEAAVGQMSWSDPEGYMSGAIILARLGSYDLALHALGTAVDGGYSVVHPLLHDPWLAGLRDDSRFREILRRAETRRNEALTVFRAEGGERLLGLRAAA
ncbi:MAG TPA: protein kinase [Vicinamibacterales bacterium]|jgi:serine/threonine protein kinase/tetratricopeptide (TPR) repeat protein|nr:protein kinase [Vicinamibacterales bacterium]